LRRDVLALARNGYAPIQYWLGLPLLNIQRWAKEHNKLIDELKRSEDV